MRGLLRRRLARAKRGVDAAERRLNAALPGPLKVGALTLYLHATPPPDRLDRAAGHRYWDRWSDAAVAALLGLQIGGLAVVAVAAWIALGQTRATPLNDPANTVAIPGVNEFMPVAAAPAVVAALVLATAVHEGGHAIACRRAGVRIEEWGIALFLGVIPLAAYVLPGEELDDASPRSRARVYSIGVFHNLLVAAAAFAVLWSPLAASPTDAFHAYFGWAMTGEAAPTAATVAALGPITNIAFWTALLNANFGLLNALPIAVLDGGRVLAIALETLSDRAGGALSTRARRAVVHAAGGLAVLLVAAAVFAPLVPR